DYIRTAWAKGQTGRVVIWHHALKNAMLPVVTIIGIEFAFLIGGLVVTETVFNLPGVARFLVQAILWRDYPVVQNLVMFVALVVGVASTLLGSVLGGIIGLLSGYVGGKSDLVTQRVLDILQGLPLLVLALVMSAALGPAIHNVIIAISIPIVPRAARVIRASVLSIRETQYVEAARALGVRHVRIAFRHILPNTIGPFIVLCTAQLGSAILVEATLSFL